MQKLAVDNYVSGGQLGGDIYKNTFKILLESTGRTWKEADIGMQGNVSRAKQLGTRLLYSNNELLYITTNHYKTVHFIGKY
ncbi:ribonuclease domain-containing protein [Listeria aquatica]|uniref:ribonuclease domain-containing protein n=1 Tax=Listeria aquatica TaxID=1494960 RepID=UPI0031F578FA